MWGIYEEKKPKSALLADNTQGLITTKQTKPKPVASAAPHLIKAYVYPLNYIPNTQHTPFPPSASFVPSDRIKSLDSIPYMVSKCQLLGN